MQFQQKVILSVGFACVLAFVNASNFIGQESDNGLLSYMARSNDLLRQDPSRSLECFSYYIPLINEIASRYESNYQACLNESLAARSKADNATWDQRNDLANAAESSCALLSQCGEDESVEGIFECYINGGAANIQTMYSINANASQELAALREQYYLIQSDEYRCTNDTKRAYEKESAAAYANLNSCILGNSPVPTQGPATTTIAATEAPAEPETTTIDVITEEPEQPETTTGEPEELSSFQDYFI
ncbi:protein TsetseEP-like [Calliphora vicina]|uniref:protein TsetseEP-like n=1 Tax=Calliphora vicina TaxID=7373 RepID=UPI00325ADAB9